MNDFVKELFERSKRDDEIIVGSEIRQAIQIQDDDIQRLRNELKDYERANVSGYCKDYGCECSERPPPTKDSTQ